MPTQPDVVQLLEPVTRLALDIRKAGETLGQDEARFLVTGYYEMQEQRVRAKAQIRELTKAKEPHKILDWYAVQWQVLENSVKASLDRYTSASPLGRWGKSVCGVGPVIVAGLMAHIDVCVPNAHNVWGFAGLAPDQEWKKGEKRPWNADLRRLCYNIGECFVRTQNNEKDVYGQRFVSRKAYEQAKNEKLEYADQAERTLEKKNYKKSTEAYKHYSQGLLPPAHIHARARRWAVKLFLSHWHTVGHFIETGYLPPRPKAFDYQPLGSVKKHTHLIIPPNCDSIEGLLDAIKEDWVRYGDLVLVKP